jgi:hypothetical protein
MVCKYFIDVCPWDEVLLNGTNLEEAMHKSKLAGRRASDSAKVRAVSKSFAELATQWP